MPSITISLENYFKPAHPHKQLTDIVQTMIKMIDRLAMIALGD
jgi:hypothetical protein